MRALDARPIKKVVEAKARKRKRLIGRLNAARKKAEAIMGQEDVSAGSRMKQVEKVLAKARKSEFSQKKKKKPTRSDKMKRKGPPLDRRMRSDRRMRGIGRDGKNVNKIQQKRLLAKAQRVQRSKGKRTR